MEKSKRNERYTCTICKLTYTEEKWKEKCESWCKKHPSCNLEITSYSIEVKKSRNQTEEDKNNRQNKSVFRKKFSFILFLAFVFELLVFYNHFYPIKPFVAKIFHLNRIATGYIKNGNYTDRKLAVFEEVNPKEGFTSQLVLGNIVLQMATDGVIDMTKMEDLYKARGGIPQEERDLLTKSSTTPLTINTNNANWIVNILWAIGLSNKMDINKQSPVNGPDVNNFASTGGWTLGKEENGGAYFNKYPLISLTAEQQKRVKMIADSTYRPCCNNSTFFQDCNHGSAGMALIELGVSQGLSDREIYKTLLAFNSFWFPQNYIETALYFNVIKNTDWTDVDPKLALSKDYSSIGGWIANIDTPVHEVVDLLPKSQSGGSCGA